jgi:hypothetical protein
VTFNSLNQLQCRLLFRDSHVQVACLDWIGTIRNVFWVGLGSKHRSVLMSIGGHVVPNLRYVIQDWQLCPIVWLATQNVNLLETHRLLSVTVSQYTARCPDIDTGACDCALTLTIALTLMIATDTDNCDCAVRGARGLPFHRSCIQQRSRQCCGTTTPQTRRPLRARSLRAARKQYRRYWTSVPTCERWMPMAAAACIGPCNHIPPRHQPPNRCVHPSTALILSLDPVQFQMNPGALDRRVDALDLLESAYRHA